MWFRWTAPINQKKKKKKKKSIRYVFFYLSSNSFGSFLSQTSNLVHRSLHLSTWSPRLTSHDLYLRCRSLASRAERSFYFGPPKINGRNSKLSLFWLHNFEGTFKKKKELWRYKHHCFILSSSFAFVLQFFVAFLLITAHERMYSLSIRTKEGSTHTHVPSLVLLLCTYS